MKYHEAIRMGSMLREQAFGHVLDIEGKTCANGAALEAIGRLQIAKLDYCRETIRARFVYATGEAGPCPVAQCTQRFNDPMGELFSLMYPDKFKVTTTGQRRAVWNMVEHLNDYHRWTREQIAAWMQPLEEAWHAEQERKFKQLFCASPKRSLVLLAAPVEKPELALVIA